ncbi:hypothetical protein D3C71_1831590 [compost metagenome]
MNEVDQHFFLTDHSPQFLDLSFSGELVQTNVVLEEKKKLHYINLTWLIQHRIEATTESVRDVTDDFFHYLSSVLSRWIVLSRVDRVVTDLTLVLN